MKEAICRICLKAIKGKNSEIIEGLIKEILEVLLLKLNLTVSEDARICHSCIKELEKFFEFKSSCLYTEDRIYPLISSASSTEVDLHEIYIKENKNANLTKISSNQKVCRFCMQLVEDDYCGSLKEMNQDAFLQNMLQKYFPEIDLSVIRDPVLCDVCLDILSSYFTFVLDCLHIEDNIRKYSNVKGTNSRGYVNLCDAAEFISKTQKEHIAIKKVIKLERHCFSDDERGNYAVMEVENFSVTMENKEGNLKYKPNSMQRSGVPSPPRRKNDRSDTQKRKGKSKYIQKHIIDVPSREEALHKCEVCSYSTNYKSRIERHKRVHKKSKKPFDKIKTLSVSLQDSPEVPVYRCDTCSYETSSSFVLRQHKKTIHNVGKVKIYRCEDCEYTTKYGSVIIRHIATHLPKSNTKMYKCSHCECESKFAANIRKHITRLHVTM